jgi:hypothetical protein
MHGESYSVEHPLTCLPLQLQPVERIAVHGTLVINPQNLNGGYMEQ